MLARRCHKPFSAEFYVLVVGVILGGATTSAAQTKGPNQPARVPSIGGHNSRVENENPRDVLSRPDWKRVDSATERALRWLAAQQRDDGAFPTIDTGQPAVTSLCVMAFLAEGHLPGDGGPYGRRLQRALEYILGCQKQNGLIALMGPDGSRIDRRLSQEVGVTTAYDHAISALVLSEAYGMGAADKGHRIQNALSEALAATLEMQRWPRQRQEDKGGWRYVNEFGPYESDLSLTGWELMFLRSARNAGFKVAKEPIDNAVAYVRRSFSKKYGTFTYNIAPIDTRSRAMAGAAILAMAHAGLHDAAEARLAGEWLLRQKFDQYNRVETFGQSPWWHDRYHYAVFYACQGTYQLGGKYWKNFFPLIVPVLLKNQQASGSWAPESHPNDGRYGNAYTTALMVLSLGASNQLLPIFQR
jgi:hypothetical protein